MANTESGTFRITNQQVAGALAAASIALLLWVGGTERQRIDRLEQQVQLTIPADIQVVRTEIAAVKADIAVLKAQGAASQVTLDRIDRRMEALAGGGTRP